MCWVRDNEMAEWFDCPMYHRCRDLFTLDGMCWKYDRPCLNARYCLNYGYECDYRYMD